MEPNSSVPIWGCGAVGLAVIIGCKEAGASRIIAVDINPDKWPKGKSISILLTHIQCSSLAKPHPVCFNLNCI